MPPARIVLFLSTTGALVLVGRSVLIGPLALPWALFAAAFYTAVLLSGVFFIRLRMFTDAVITGPKLARGVALTFDDGPDPKSTPQVLDLLDGVGAKATFFVIGKKAERHPELVREILRRGHAVGLHSYAHPRLFALYSARSVERDLLQGINVLVQLTGTRPFLFRPPIGHTNPTIARIANELGLVVVGWSVAGQDGVRWAHPTEVVARVVPELRDGAIVVMHDAAERGNFEPCSPRALPQILSALQGAKLASVPLTEWVASGREATPLEEGS